MPNLNPPFYNVVYRARHYCLHGYWRAWYEPCLVVGFTKKSVTVQSLTFPDAPFYPGGKFSLKRDLLERSGQAHHSRHEEYFYLKPQSDEWLFPIPALLEDPEFVCLEAKALHWAPIPLWEPWQRECWGLAKILDRPLKEIVDRWKSSRESALESLWTEVRSRGQIDL